MFLATLSKSNTLQLTAALVAFSLLAAPTSGMAHEGFRPAFHKAENVPLQSTIQVPQDVMQRATKAGRDAYNAVLQPYAKISPEAAKLVAQKQFPGTTVMDVGLHAVHNNLVYLVLLTKDNTRYLVIVDAGNEKILSTREMPIKRHLPPRHIW